jgi:hypothetical protein
MQDLAAPNIDVSLLIPLSHEYSSRYTCQAGNLYDMLQLKVVDFPGKPSDLLFSHTLWPLASQITQKPKRRAQCRLEFGLILKPAK